MIDILIKSILVFIAVGITDTFWTLYITYSTEYKVWRASFYSMMIAITSSFATIEYVQDRRMVIPAAAGAFVGTIIPLLWKRYKKKK